MYRRDGAVCPVNTVQASAAEGAGEGDIYSFPFTANARPGFERRRTIGINGASVRPPAGTTPANDPVPDTKGTELGEGLCGIRHALAEIPCC